jgi:chemotaxis protein methyltransferase CheR
MNMNKITDNEFQLMRDFVEEQSGISLELEKAYLLESRLVHFIEKYKCKSFSDFYQILKEGFIKDLKNRVIDAIATNETLWFRDTHPYEILEEKILPSFAQAVREGKKDKIRIWSAACSTGQEPYSLAITVHNYCIGQTVISKDMVQIIATDISDNALEKAKAGQYDSMAMSRGITSEQLNRYFTKDSRSLYTVNKNIKDMVTFQKFNLQDDPFILEPHFDLVFMRYVAIYFNDSFKKNLYRRLARLLSPKGFLVIGSVESLRGVSEDFNTFSHASDYYYQCKK